MKTIILILLTAISSTSVFSQSSNESPDAVKINFNSFLQIKVQESDTVGIQKIEIDGSLHIEEDLIVLNIADFNLLGTHVEWIDEKEETYNTVFLIKALTLDPNDLTSYKRIFIILHIDNEDPSKIFIICRIYPARRNDSHVHFEFTAIKD